jgi:hypothetical protein
MTEHTTEEQLTELEEARRIACLENATNKNVDDYKLLLFAHAGKLTDEVRRLRKSIEFEHETTAKALDRMIAYEEIARSTDEDNKRLREENRVYKEILHMTVGDIVAEKQDNIKLREENERLYGEILQLKDDINGYKCEIDALQDIAAKELDYQKDIIDEQKEKIADLKADLNGW